MFAHALKSLSWAFAGKWFQMIVGVVTLAVTARVLGPGPYGVFAAALLIVGVGDIFVSGAPAALTRSLVQRPGINRGHEAASFWLCAAVGAAMWIGVALVAHPAERWLDAPRVAEILPWCGSFLFLNAIAATPAALLVRDMRFKDVTLIESSAAVAASVVGVVLALSGAGVWSLVAMEGSRCVTRTALTFGAARWRPGLSGSWLHLREIGAINSSAASTAAFAYADRNAPRMIIAAFMGAEALGFYTIAMRLMDILSGLFIGPFSWVAMPIITRTLGDRRGLETIIKGALRYSSLLSIPVFVGVAVVAPMLTPVLLGANWLPAVLTIQLVVLAGVRSATSTFNSVVLVGVGRLWAPVVLHVTGAVLSAALALAAAPFGIEAVAAAMLLRTLLTMPLAAYFLTDATRIPVLDLLRQSWPALGASAVMAALLLALQDRLVGGAGAFGALVISVPLGALIYLGVIALFARRSFRSTLALARALLVRDQAALRDALADRPASRPAADAGPRIAFFGLFGAGNFGNEGSLEGMHRAMRLLLPNARLSAICADPDKVRAAHGLDAIPIAWRGFSSAWARTANKLLLGMPSRIANILHAARAVRGLDALVVPGTGIFDDFADRPTGMPYDLLRWCLIARLAGVKIAFVSVGAGPILHPVSCAFLHAACRLAHYRSYRDEISRAFVMKTFRSECEGPVVPDLAFLLPTPPDPPRPPAGPLVVGVGVMSYAGWRPDRSDAQQIRRDYEDKIVAFITWLLQTGRQVRLLIGAEIGRPLADAIAARVLAEAPEAAGALSIPYVEDLASLMSAMADIDVVIATRFHNVVCALRMAKPTISLGYAAKNDVLLQSVGLGDFTFDVESFDLEELKARVDRLCAERVRLAAAVARAVDGHRDALVSHVRKVIEALDLLVAAPPPTQSPLAAQDALSKTFRAKNASA